MLGTGAKKSNSNYCTFVAVVLLLLCLCVNSWGWSECYQQTGWSRCSAEAWDRCDMSVDLAHTCPSAGSGTYTNGYITAQQCNSTGYMAVKVIECQSYCCSGSTEEEVNAALCSHNPDLPNCAVTKDTLLFACSESIVNGQAVATIYKLSCKATNGEVTECNGKQDVDISTDGQPVRTMDGTCAQNGIPNGVFGGADVQDSTELPNGANADCYAIIGSKCHMKDKVSGNTFTCDCDGSCQVALQNLMAGSANCTNPYPQPTSSSDSLNIGGSSGSGGDSSPSSSGSGEGGSSPSSSPSDSSGDFEYDYTALLEDIRANTQYTGEQASNLNNKALVANEYLRQIATKDWNPTINVGSPNVTLNADTNRAPAEILGLLNEKLSGGEPNSNDTAGTGSRLDGYLSSIDSIVGEGTPDMSDSIGNAVRGIHTSFNALKDSLGNSAINDSLNRWNGLLTNNGVITGNGSNTCPSILTQQFTWAFPLGRNTINIQVGTLGKYICTPISPFNVTIWQFCRVILRAMVAIGCMLWLYKAVLGIDGGNSEED